ncbi:MAG: TIGR00269 family protein [Armatimonadota bacterium]|nr:TIGR00269 family protein [Armatimonadota bacterium]MDR7439353.1 TIGR00269 family protein [Armatimonadota bacterium]MDR7563192.1 TIGR00269 family protein [Armatimonadota bacterium]MDR7567393.1 TIGR00269 family protein [Armatimonadota bacterium]MDR7602832.1 TIGR00269 family protein [Armatimonadota bacterium]
MRCVRCKATASVEVRRHNAAYCGPHFLEWFEHQVQRAVDRDRMFTRSDRVLVAVSGGKDSLVLWDVLLRLGYRATGLHLNLGIGEYSRLSQEKCESFARERGVELVVVDLPATCGVGVEELARLTGRVACSACGLSKRYLFNKVALEYGFDVVATAHNLDDEAAVLLSNLISGNVEALARQAPVLERTHPALVKKVKPLYRIAERETAAYAVLRGIDYVLDECPRSVGARTLLLKEALNLLERDAPGTKQSLYWNFLEKLRPLLQDHQAPLPVRSCLHCGQPTTAEVCAFCRMTERAAAKLRVRTLPSPHPVASLP